MLFFYTDKLKLFNLKYIGEQNMKKILLILSICVAILSMSACSNKNISIVNSTQLKDLSENNIEKLSSVELNNLSEEAENIRFTAKFPDDWEFKNENEGESGIPLGEFQGIKYIYSEDKLMGYIGYSSFKPYEDLENPIPDEEYYKTVFPELRLSNMYIWDPFTSVIRNKTEETGIVDIEYIDEQKINDFPGAMANVPRYNTKGILAYNKDLKIYVGIALMPEVSNEFDLTELAKTVSLSK